MATSSMMCLPCGISGNPCCEKGVTKTEQSCADGQQCGDNKYCPGKRGPQWAGQPCGSLPKQCNGLLTCQADPTDPTKPQLCTCPAKGAEFTSCDGKDSLCGNASSFTCDGFPTDSTFQAKSGTKECTLFKADADCATVTGCAPGEFGLAMLNGTKQTGMKECMKDTADGNQITTALVNDFDGKVTETNYCYIPKSNK